MTGVQTCALPICFDPSHQALIVQLLYTCDHTFNWPIKGFLCDLCGGNSLINLHILFKYKAFAAAMQRDSNKYLPASIGALHFDRLLAGGIGKAEYKVPAAVWYQKPSIYGGNFNLLWGHSSLLGYPALGLINQTLFINRQSLFDLTLGNRGHQQSNNKSYKVVHWPSMGHNGG